MGLLEDVQAIPYDLESDRTIRRLKFANQELKARGDALAKAVERLEHEREVLLGLRDNRNTTKWAKPAKVSKGQAAAVFVNSDWHIEETITRRETAGLNQWTMDDVDACVPRLAQRGLRLTERYRMMAQIDEAVVLLLGDFITGHLRPEHLNGNSMTPIRATQKATALLRGYLEMLLQHGKFKKITVATVTGNHGRTTEKLWASGRNDTSYETLIYEHLRESMRDKRLQWSIGEGEFHFIDIYDWRARLVHGDCFKYGGGVGGLSIPVNRRVDKWDADRNTRADMTFFGHLHTFLWNAPNRWVSNGALPGVGPYSMKYGASEPCQAFAVVDKDRCLTDATKIFAR